MSTGLAEGLLWAALSTGIFVGHGREFSWASPWASLPSLIEQLGVGGVLAEPWAETSVAAKSPRGNMGFS